MMQGLARPTASTNRSVARLNAHLSIPLYRNGYALMLSSATTSVLGVAYWILAAHTYTTQAIGLNAAAIAAVMFLAGAAQLNLMSALLRFVPGAGRATGRFVMTVYLVSVTVAAAASLSVLGLDHRVSVLGFLGASPVFSRWFTLAAMAWCIFVLQDSVLTGLRRATWVLVENAAFALAKVVLLIVFAGALPRYGVFASWMIPMAATLLPVNLVIFRRLIPRHVRATQGRATALVPAQVVRYAAADYLGALCWLASTTLLPVLVASLAGPTATAYFFLCWQIAYALYLISPNMGSSLIVEAANDSSKLGIYSYRVCVQTARLVVPLAVILALGAPYVLRVFGGAYAAHGAMLLRLLALSAIPNIVTSLSVSVARARRHTGTAVAVLASLCAIVLALSYLLVPVYGITGVGIAWVVSQTGIALFVLGTQLRPLWATEQAFGVRRSAFGRAEQSGTPFSGVRRSLFGVRPAPRDPPERRTPNAKRLAGGPVAATKAAVSRRAYEHAGTALRLVTLLRPLWSYPGRRRRRAEAAALLPTILPSITPLPDVPAPAAWVAGAMPPTVSDVTVLATGPRRRPPSAVLKLPRTDAATRSLRRQDSVLARLHADPRLGEWRRLLPVLLAGGEVDGQPYVVERMLPGRDARTSLRAPEGRTQVQAAAAAAIGELHRRTAATVVVEGATLERWVDAPLLVVRRVAALHPGAAGHEGALERLALELRAALAGRKLCVATVHGDFTPGNILMAPDGATVTGIIDWTEAAVADVPLLDLVTLLLSTRMLVQRRELGAVTVEALTSACGERVEFSLTSACGGGALLQGTPWTRDEQALIDAAQAALPGEPVGHRALVLLCWLRHVAANLTKADRYAGHRVWMARNVWVVLDRL